MTLLYNLDRRSFCSASILCLALQAKASTHELDLRGAAVPWFAISEPASTYSLHRVNDVATGSASVTPFFIAVGDLVHVTLSFDGALTISGSDSPGAEIYLNIGSFSGNFTAIYTEAVSYSYQGSVVEPFSGTIGHVPNSGSGGGLILGGSAAGASPSFTFDSIEYLATISQTFGMMGPVDSIPVSGGEMSFAYRIYAAVPEPSSAATLILGIAAVLAAFRMRRIR